MESSHQEANRPRLDPQRSHQNNAPFLQGKVGGFHFSGGSIMNLLDILFYACIGIVLFLAGRNVWQSYKEERELDEWVIKGRDGER
jgi:hypothetical protein